MEAMPQNNDDIFDIVLQNDESNFRALYGKSLVLYRQGNIEESAEFLRRAMNTESLGEASKINEVFKNTLIDMLEPKPRTKMVILDELKRRYNDIKQESFVLNFMTVPTSGTSTHFSTTSFPRTRTQGDKQKPERVTCVICHKSFTKLFSLNRHLLIHSGTKSHHCSVCGRSFIQKSDLQRHEATHNSSFNIPCSFPDCSKRFKTVKNMKSHLLTHSQERPFKCSHCDKDFKVKRLLRFHEGLHQDKKPFNCDVCGKGFLIKQYLKSHLKVHMIVRPFACPVCNALFKRNYDMKYHLKIRHLLNPIESTSENFRTVL